MSTRDQIPWAAEGKTSNVQELLRPHKTIRDAVHGDIMLTRLETNIMDTPEFQRLHKIKQLGAAYLVYPTAKHTRFDHSLGVLHMSNLLLRLVQDNPFKDESVSINEHHILLTRLTALVHDLAHIPFGHTFEDEGQLFPGQWHDDERVKLLLSEGSSLGRLIVGTINRAGFDGKAFLNEVRNLLVTHEESEIVNLPFPFIADIVFNTICADLLDYVKRDIYFCGLREMYDERFLSYFYVTRHNGRPRLVLRLTKPRTRRLRRDVLSETLHLLRLRYSLAEKVYYHHTKICASAMLISALDSAMRASPNLKQKLLGVGDDALLAFLRTEGGPTAQCLVDRFEGRQLYKPVYKLTYVEEKLGSEVAKRRREVIANFVDKDCRYEAERVLEKMNFLTPGQVVIYCPARGMGRKAVRALVDWGDGIGPLEDIDDVGVKAEITSSILHKHTALWSMYVFVDSNVAVDKRLDIQTDCVRDIIREQNDIENPEYRQITDSYLERYRARAEEELNAVISAKAMKSLPAAGRPREGARYFGNILDYHEFKELVQGAK